MKKDQVSDGNREDRGDSDFKKRLVKWIRQIGGKRYQPEKHYMRGPGPATLQRQANEPRQRGM